jgi:citrate lyase subunit beta/citryl-CoA lyase
MARVARVDRTHVEARRSWLFVEGANEAALRTAVTSGADVLIQELEDFTPPDRRADARALSPDILAQWKAAGVVAAVRVNPLDGDGRDDLEAVMRGAPDVVLLPKANDAGQILALDESVAELERRYGLKEGSTELVPNVELARGLMNTFAICAASPRVCACVVASEDMAADLGAERSRDGGELDYVRTRFHLECVAAGVMSIDRPYTWTDSAGVEADSLAARRLGYRAKSAVHAEHAAIINRVLTPSSEEVAQAKRLVDAFEAAQAAGNARVEVDGSLVEVPIYLNARRLLDRAARLGIV